jgi:hypothetical protein
MADFRSNPGNGQRLDTLKIAFTRHARANLEQRLISVHEVEKALREGEIVSVDADHYVIRLDDAQGGIRVMADKAGDSIIVRTAVRADELLANAG